MAVNANKNSMLPTYQGTYRDMVGALRAGDISSPCWMFLEDRNALAFIHWEKNEQGDKVLVPHIMLWNKIELLEQKVEIVNTQLDDMKDPETGEPIKVTEYVADTVAPITNQVSNISETVEDIKQNGAAIMLTLDGGDE